MFNISSEQFESMVRGSLSLELKFVSAFIDQQNGQLNKYLHELYFENNKSDDHGFSYDEKRNDLMVSGLSSFEYDLNGVFKEELPEYINQSQLVILWAMLERSLRSIVDEICRIKSWDVYKKKKGESDFFSLIKSLKKIDDSNIQSAFDFLNNNVRVVRNYIVHGDGKSKLEISHKFLEIENGCLHKIHNEYIKEVQFAIAYLGANL